VDLRLGRVTPLLFIGRQGLRPVQWVVV